VVEATLQLCELLSAERSDELRPFEQPRALSFRRAVAQVGVCEDVGE
jgi:hypothetical protein